MSCRTHIDRFNFRPWHTCLRTGHTTVGTHLESPRALSLQPRRVDVQRGNCSIVYQTTTNCIAAAVEERGSASGVVLDGAAVGLGHMRVRTAI